MKQGLSQPGLVRDDVRRDGVYRRASSEGRIYSMDFEISNRRLKDRAEVHDQR
jgi:hypothetical protein